ncbi:testis-specific expressed protein 55-like isoform X3 [Argonauta hians]
MSEKDKMHFGGGSIVVQDIDKFEIVDEEMQQQIAKSIIIDTEEIRLQLKVDKSATARDERDTKIKPDDRSIKSPYNVMDEKSNQLSKIYSHVPSESKGPKCLTKTNIPATNVNLRGNANNYLHKHHLFSLFQELMKNVALNQPGDVISFMVSEVEKYRDEAKNQGEF